MFGTAVNQSKWNQRVARARTLADARPAAAGLLSFYAELAEFQHSLASEPDPPDASQAVEIGQISGAIRLFLSWLQHRAPTDVVGAACNIQPDRWVDLVRSYLAAEGWGARHQEPGQDVVDDGADLEDEVVGIPPTSSELDRFVPFVLEVVLQPFAERLPIQPGPRVHSHSPMRCPRCAALPVAAVLREEGHGARRSLLCALCLSEWDCPRIVCPACGERDFEKLPIYTAEQFTHARIDACDSCRHYVKTIDLSKDGTAVPCVDDIATVPLDLWAREQGYVRVKRNVLGL